MGAPRTLVMDLVHRLNSVLHYVLLNYVLVLLVDALQWHWNTGRDMCMRTSCFLSQTCIHFRACNCVQKCSKGVFPPSGFDPRAADRSKMPPNAHMWLEHMHCMGMQAWMIWPVDKLAWNVHFIHNTQQHTWCTWKLAMSRVNLT